MPSVSASLSQTSLAGERNGSVRRPLESTAIVRPDSRSVAAMLVVPP